METRSKIISFIVPVYKTASVVTRCLDSIYNQDMEEDDFEIIIVNDGSPDEASKIISNYSLHHSNIVYIEQNNQGVSAARNKGIEKATGRYIAFVDSDDTLVPHSFKRIIDIADKESCDLCFFYAQYYQNKQVIFNYKNFELLKVYTGEEIILHGLQVVSIWSNIYRREFIKGTNIEFSTEISNSEDVDFNYRLYPYAKKAIFTNIRGYNYIINNDSASHNTNVRNMRKKANDTIYFSKHILDFSNSNTEQLSESIKSYYKRLINSTIAGTVLDISLHEKKYGKGFLKEFIKACQKLDLYPVKKPTLSKRLDLFMPLINCRPLLLLVAKVATNFKR